MHYNKYMFIHDQHCHTHFSMDSNVSNVKMIEKAISLGCQYFVTTNHCDFRHQDGLEDYIYDINEEINELETLQKEYPNIQVLHGIEVGYQSGAKNLIDEYLKKHHFDVINLSIHYDGEIDYYYSMYDKKEIARDLINRYLEQIYEAIQYIDNYDVLSHFDYVFRSAYRYDNTISAQDYEEKIVKIMKFIILNNKSLEINTKVQTHLSIEHTLYILRLYKSLGGEMITLSSDAHKLEMYENAFDIYMPLLKKEGFDYLIYYVDRKPYKWLINR